MSTTELAIALDANQIVEAYKTSGIDKIVASVAEAAKAEAEKHDPSTESGRKKIASVAYQVARSKTAVDEQGKALGEEYRRNIDALNEDRRKARTSLDELKEEIRRPVTEYEQREKNRVEGHAKALEFVVSCGVELQDLSEEALDGVRSELHDAYDSEEWEEFQKRADEAFELSLSRIDKEKDRRAELVRLKLELAAKEKAEAERLQMEREERIAKEAAEQARREAEERAQRERDEAEAKLKAEREAVARKAAEARAKADAEKAKIEADLKAQLEKAKEAERLAKEAKQKEADEKARIEAEEAKRKADAEHVRKVKNEVFKDLQSAVSELDFALTVDQGKALVTAIAEGKVRHVSIHI